MKPINFLMILVLVLLMAAPSEAVISRGYTHTNDYYAVNYDEEGDAYVRAKLIIHNDLDTPLSSLSLEIPRQVYIYQLVQEATSRYCDYYGTESYCDRYESGLCAHYSQRSVCQSYSDSGQQYVQVKNLTEEQTSSTTLLHVGLPQEVAKDGYTTISLIYKIPRQAQSFLSVYSFEFKTIIDGNAKLIENVRVSVDVQSGLTLQGRTGQVQYQPDFFGATASKALASGYSESMTRNYMQSIEYSGGYVKTATNLDPYESFSVKGSYSRNAWLLNLPGLIFGLIIIGGLLVIAGKAIRAMFRKLADYSYQKKGKQDSVGLLVIATGFLNALGLVIVWFMVWFMLTGMNSWMSYPISSVLGPFLFLIAAIVILSVLLVPSIYLGSRFGLGAGIANFVATIVWLILLFFALLLFAALARQPQVYYGRGVV